MGTLKLKADPTFKAKVAIAVAGGADAEVEFTFKHRTREELLKFMQECEGRLYEDTIMDCAVGWELEDAFTRDNVSVLLQNYMTAGKSVQDAYLDELTKARAKN
jgi:hypothetical protein